MIDIVTLLTGPLQLVTTKLIAPLVRSLWFHSPALLEPGDLLEMLWCSSPVLFIHFLNPPTWWDWHPLNDPFLPFPSLQGHSFFQLLCCLQTAHWFKPRGGPFHAVYPSLAPRLPLHLLLCTPLPRPLTPPLLATIAAAKGEAWNFILLLIPCPA